MKTAVKLLAIILTIIMVAIPLTTVYAESSKTQDVLDILNESDVLKSNNGTAIYEGGMIDISYSVPMPSYSNMFFQYEGNVIDYTFAEITSYDEAKHYITHVLYALKLLFATLKLNGYTQEQIDAYFSAEDSDPTYETNGFEIKKAGEQQEFQSDDGDSSTTITPVSIKIDVSRANINNPGDAEFEETATTVQNVVDSLYADDSFRSYTWEDGTLVYENDIWCEEYYDEDEEVSEGGYIEIDHTDYNYEYYDVSFSCEDDVLIYEAEEMEDYDTASSVMSHEMWATIIMQYALQANGYTYEEIAEFFSSEENEFNYEKNGIEIKELGETKEFEGEMGDTIYVSPVSIKIDFKRANIETAGEETQNTETEAEEVKYEVLDGKDQTFSNSKGGKLSFRFSIDYDTFVKEGKVLIDDKEVSKDNYAISKGSTVITFNDDYAKTISAGKHTILASVNNGQVKAEFTVEKAEETDTQTAPAKSPKMGDASDAGTVYILLLALSAASVLIALAKHKKFN